MSKKKNGVQKLIGFERFTKYGVRTDKAEFAFFAVEPTNISVMLLSMVPDLELIALDSCECFDSNKDYVRKRLREEKNEAIRKLLEADYNFLDEVQTEMSSARQFLFAVRFRKEKEEQVFNLINRIDKTISDHGFSAKRMSKPDIKRMLALYFGTSITGDEIEDIEGESYFKEDMENEE